MLKDNQYSFTFVVLAYNHEDYIFEHLESIRFLISKYGANLYIQLIITDDCSVDLTTTKIDKWLLHNSNLFSKVTYLRNSKNQGTCKSLLNSLQKLETDICKITAGDDVYSYENIFENTREHHDCNIISGRTLYLHGTHIEQKWTSKLFEIATDHIYKDKPLLTRFSGYNYTNAPNLFYPLKLLKDLQITNFVANFKVIEDFPLQLASAKYYPEVQFQLKDKVYVYYRRTPGSTYLVKNADFISDLEQAYSYLYFESTSIIDKIILRNRMFFLRTRSRYLKRLLNLESYLFVLRALVRFMSILHGMRGSNVDIIKHQLHFNYIKQCAEAYTDD